MRQSHFCRLRACQMMKAMMILALGGCFPFVARAEEIPTLTTGYGPPANALYDYAKTRRQAGDLDDAMHELRKVLLIAPYHRQARRELRELELMRGSSHDQAIEEALTRLERQSR